MFLLSLFVCVKLDTVDINSGCAAKNIKGEWTEFLSTKQAFNNYRGRRKSETEIQKAYLLRANVIISFLTWHLLSSNKLII